jgi:hypothetical protein
MPSSDTKGSLIPALLSRGRLVTVFLVAFAFGLVSYPILRSVRDAIAHWANKTESATGTSAQFRAPPYVILVLGQSNAANHAQTRTAADSSHYSFYSSKFYPLVDPLPGCTGNGGSPWPSFAEALAAATDRQVVVACLAVSGTGIAQWLPGQPNFLRVKETVAQLSTAGLTVSGIVWHQGETDANLRTRTADYAQLLEQLVVALRVLAPGVSIFVCKVSSTAPETPLSTSVRTAQQKVIDTHPFVFAGVDTDTFEPQMRSDGIHFTLLGAELFGKLMAAAVRNPADVATSWPKQP